ncbi:hypothetical protein [Ascidiimonas aurantiaca]|uniref:hypothetical protein n=1 Tax=Ascidiimonas aurantiaca TaxID=1685432 RepID=UPI0030EEC095
MKKKHLRKLNFNKTSICRADQKAVNGGNHRDFGNQVVSVYCTICFNEGLCIPCPLTDTET